MPRTLSTSRLETCSWSAAVPTLHEARGTRLAVHDQKFLARQRPYTNTISHRAVLSRTAQLCWIHQYLRAQTQALGSRLNILADLCLAMYLVDRGCWIYILASIAWICTDSSVVQSIVQSSSSSWIEPPTNLYPDGRLMGQLENKFNLAPLGRALQIRGMSAVSLLVHLAGFAPVIRRAAPRLRGC